ncbi:HalOD1 output domain-containing protein [Halobaculum magnesiiphilum]|uniref:Halobacterial output domain-containing protein n=1 Tax=Halobaculum magnesiiphilum TaxID=1017351 RepID=A0A8T8WI11_9EURY|nr:HalOD1 output domain-containing protein [Halobaculum magnesiiphilum]QZP39491.1 hypothetical protein K6T50_18095 [Halobaculum magnesiiphilum]
MDESGAPTDVPARVTWRDREWTRTARRRYDPEASADLSNVIAATIADAGDVVPTGLPGPPLYECIDIDAVTRFVENGGNPGAGRRDSVRFGHDGSLVEVRADGWVSVFAPIDDAD